LIAVAVNKYKHYLIGALAAENKEDPAENIETYRYNTLLLNDDFGLGIKTRYMFFKVFARRISYDALVVSLLKMMNAENIVLFLTTSCDAITTYLEKRSDAGWHEKEAFLRKYDARTDDLTDESSSGAITEEDYDGKMKILGEERKCDEHIFYKKHIMQLLADAGFARKKQGTVRKYKEEKNSSQKKKRVE